MHSVKTLSANKIKEIIKLHQKKYREESNLFLAEGEKALEEIVNSGIEIIDIYAVEDYKPKINLPKLTVVSENEMKKISTTATACEVLVIAKKINTEKNIQKGNKLILLDQISDPGNLGTIIRSAAAFGIDGIILFGNSIELYSPKVIRSSAGNFFKTPIMHIQTTKELKKFFPSHILISTGLKEKNNDIIEKIIGTKKMIIMFGSEAKGLSQELINISDKNIILKMNNNVESLNLAVSASILMYKLFSEN